jgi:MFS family permease
MFIVARGFIGFGLAIAGAAAPLLITELCFPSHRAPLTSLYNSSWYLGSISEWMRGSICNAAIKSLTRHTILPQLPPGPRTALSVSRTSGVGVSLPCFRVFLP